jgi:hypothetical protein
MPPVGFEPTISAGERPKTYALDRAATGTGALKVYDKPKLNVTYIISVFLVVNEFLKVTTTVKQKTLSLF